MKTQLAIVTALFGMTLFAHSGRAAITLELGSPEYAPCTQVSINGYVAAAPGVITNLVWNWDDGTTNASWFPATHTYSTNGHYTVAATANADTGESKTVTSSVVIFNLCHIDLWLMDPEYGTCGFVSIDGEVSTGTGAITNLVWTWGDGTTDESWFPATHQYPTNGDYTVAVTAFADTGVSNTVTGSVVITNVCTNIVLQLAPPEYAACGQVSINGYVAASPGAVTNLVWNWGDGTVHRSWFPATHAYAANGVFTVRVTAYSDLNESRTVTEPVTVTTVTSACSTPLLTITLNSQLSTLTVSWPSPSTDWTLQQNTNSVSSVNWSNLTSGILDDGTTKSLIVSPPNGNRFYRLHKP